MARGTGAGGRAQTHSRTRRVDTLPGARSATNRGGGLPHQSIATAIGLIRRGASKICRRAGPRRAAPHQWLEGVPQQRATDPPSGSTGRRSPTRPKEGLARFARFAAPDRSCGRFSSSRTRTGQQRPARELQGLDCLLATDRRELPQELIKPCLPPPGSRTATGRAPVCRRKPAYPAGCPGRCAPRASCGA